MRKWPVVLLLGLALLLAGCSGEVSTDLYIQDILDALELDEEVLTIGTISIEAGGSEFMEGMVNFFNMYFREPTNFREQSRDYSTYTMADVKIPVLDITDGELDLSDDIIALVVAFDEEEGQILFGLAVNQERFASAADYVQEEYWTTLSFSDFNVQVRVINDTRETVRLALQNVYVNQKPVLYSEDYQLARRDALDIRFADVMRDYAYEEGYVFVRAIW